MLYDQLSGKKPKRCLDILMSYQRANIQVILLQASKPHIITWAVKGFQTGANNRDLRCVLHPSTSGAGMQNTSRIQNLKV